MNENHKTEERAKLEQAATEVLQAVHSPVDHIEFLTGKIGVWNVEDLTDEELKKIAGQV